MDLRIHSERGWRRREDLRTARATRREERGPLTLFFVFVFTGRPRLRPRRSRRRRSSRCCCSSLGCEKLVIRCDSMGFKPAILVLPLPPFPLPYPPPVSCMVFWVKTYDLDYTAGSGLSQCGPQRGLLYGITRGVRWGVKIAPRLLRGPRTAPTAAAAPWTSSWTRSSRHAKPNPSLPWPLPQRIQLAVRAHRVI